MNSKDQIPVALQLYSLKNDCQKDFPGTVQKVGEMGYEGVEFAGYFDHSAEDIKKMLDDNGLVCAGTHIGLPTLLGDALKETVEFNLKIGNKYLIVPGLDEEYCSSIEAWKKTAEIFNDIAEKVKGQGMLVGYHNHAVEFNEMEGQIPYDVFISNTNKEVIMQLDIGNAMRTGANTKDILEKYPGRAVTLHVKEYSASDSNAFVGEGDVDWKEITGTCESVGGTKWYIIEYERPEGIPVENVKKCLDNFKQIIDS